MPFTPEKAESIARCLDFLRCEYAIEPSTEANARWYLNGNSGGVESSIFSNNDTDAEFVTVRGRMRMEGVEPQQVLDLIVDCEGRTEWDEMLSKGSFADKYGQLKTAMLPPCSADIIRLIYKGIPPVSSRDLCLLRAWGRDDDGSCWLVAESCEDPSVPVDSNCVRAELRECGYMITPVKNGCEVSYISQTNFKGWIPTMVQNILTKQQPQSLLKMYSVLTKRIAGA